MKKCIPVFFLFLLSGFVSAETKRPNVVFIIADDLGVMDLSNEGSTYHESPNIDRIAYEGVKFNRGYATCQVCSPSRASILTGTYPTKHGITSWIGDPSGEAWAATQDRVKNNNRYTRVLPPEYEMGLRDSEITLGEVFKAAGYRTLFAGKWHLGKEDIASPESNGFDVNKGGFWSGSPRGGYFAPWENPKLESGPDGESLSIRLGQETAQFIEENQDEPFFAYLSFYAVHGPIQTSEKLWRKYRDKAEEMGLAESRFVWDRNLPVRQVQDCPIYAGMMELMDDAVGIVLDKLDELGLAENTIVCFTSDHGGVSSGDAYATSNLPFRGGKGRQWEGGLRVPFYIKAPGVANEGTVSAVPVTGADWYPTLLSLAGIDVPKEQDVDGVDFTAALTGGALEDRPLFWHYPHYGNQGGEPSSVITQNGWKLIHYHEDGRDELYQIDKDIGETNDLAASQPERVKSMRAKLDTWLASTGARMPSVDPNFSQVTRDERAAYLEGEFKAKLEKQHRGFLDKDFKPNADWWGSSAAEE
ncbi:sulfatase [Pelagicoccus mobilis]|uniref:Sulfatase n=1 Tax=Pelagicoccus mobilis TaxID=415221 RepID=A0A934RRZ1_9BACT|nr:sulfatase [Pelagicoccus mobilis]MBK1875261.1 sulfatase [Pelagicoccus mobilis]